MLGLPAASVNTSCATPTPAQPSPECFNHMNGALQTALARNPTQILNLASQILQPTNFACDQTNQCRFHPVLQAVNVLPDRVEVVFAPDLHNPTNPVNDPLTQFFTLVGPSLTVPIPLGGTTVSITPDCSVPPVLSSVGAITTVFEGDSDRAAGILCGGISQP
jgi:hypothetical protein